MQDFEYFEKISLLLDVEECSDNPFGYDFYKFLLDQNIDKIVSNTKENELDFLIALLIHHGAVISNNLKDMFLNKSNNSKLIDDLVSYKNNHPIPQFKENKIYLVNNPF